MDDSETGTDWNFLFTFLRKKVKVKRLERIIYYYSYTQYQEKVCFFYGSYPLFSCSHPHTLRAVSG